MGVSKSISWEKMQSKDLVKWKLVTYSVGVSWPGTLLVFFFSRKMISNDGAKSEIGEIFDFFNSFLVFLVVVFGVFGWFWMVFGWFLMGF